MSHETEEPIDSKMSRVSDFYEGKSIFLTGASGYLGSIVLELLLRCCPGIRSIYILLREKKGVAPEQRKDQIFKKRIFKKILDTNPEVFEKVHVVVGNLDSPDLGLNQEDMKRICNEVSIIFHIAACISFIKPLRYMLIHNSRSMDYIIDLCKQLKEIDALVYTSTAYSNCNRQGEIEEQFYRLPFPAQRFLDEINGENDEKLYSLWSQCLPPWPNHYTFSKCLAENIILDKATNIPTVVIRPSIIMSSWKGAVPGYVEEGSGLVDLGIAIGKGVVRVIHADPDVKLDIVPVDIAANIHLIAAWSIGTKRSASPLIVNCTTGDTFDCTLKHFTWTLFAMTEKHPLPNSFQKQSLVIQKYDWLYKLISAFEHFVPALVMDWMLMIRGRSPRLRKIYKFFDKAMESMHFFISTEFRFQSRNFKSLSNQLCLEDQQVLSASVDDLSIEALAETLPTGAPFYQWDVDKRSFEERQKLKKLRFMFITAIQFVVLFVIGAAIYNIYGILQTAACYYYH